MTYFGRTAKEWADLRAEWQLYIEQEGHNGPVYIPYNEINLAVARRTGYRPFEFPVESKAVGVLLGEISTDSIRIHGDMLTALVVRADTLRPGNGFFVLATQHNLLRPAPTPRQKDAFWIAQCTSVFARL
jgi:hypothetical protein